MSASVSIIKALTAPFFSTNNNQSASVPRLLSWENQRFAPVQRRSPKVAIEQYLTQCYYCCSPFGCLTSTHLNEKCSAPKRLLEVWREQNCGWLNKAVPGGRVWWRGTFLATKKSANNEIWPVYAKMQTRREALAWIALTRGKCAYPRTWNEITFKARASSERKFEKGRYLCFLGVWRAWSPKSFLGVAPRPPRLYLSLKYLDLSLIVPLNMLPSTYQLVKTTMILITRQYKAVRNRKERQMKASYNSKGSQLSFWIRIVKSAVWHLC